MKRFLIKSLVCAGGAAVGELGFEKFVLSKLPPTWSKEVRWAKWGTQGAAVAGVLKLSSKVFKK